MPRRSHVHTAGLVFHVMNRAARRARIFSTEGDYAGFERALSDAADEVPMPLFSYVVMPNHWHLVVRPPVDGALSRYMQCLTRTHAQRWHRAHGTVGTGALYQGRYRPVAVQDDHHFLTVCRYVERNPVRAGLAVRARDWRWSSAWTGSAPGRLRLADWPVPRPTNWPELLETDHTEAELRSMRRCTTRGVPFGDAVWVGRTAERLDVERHQRGRGRPPRKG